MLQKIILVAPLFFIFAYKAYKSFRYADSKIQLGKFVLGFTFIVLILVALYSLTIAGLSGYAFLIFALTAYVLAPGPLLGLFVGSAVGISVREWRSEKQSHKTIVTACWLFILLVGVIYFSLWQQRETFQHKNRVKTQLALDFVKRHSAVIEKVGSNSTPALASMIFPKETTPDDHHPLPIGYVISIDDQQHFYAIVSTPKSAEDQQFTLDCITPLTHDERYGNRDRCK